MSDLAELRRVAEAATPGPWIAMIEDDREAWVTSKIEPGPMGRPEPGEPFGVADVDAEFIATFDPPTVLALLDVVEAACNPHLVVMEYADDIPDAMNEQMRRAADLLSAAKARLEALDD